MVVYLQLFLVVEDGSRRRICMSSLMRMETILGQMMRKRTQPRILDLVLELPEREKTRWILLEMAQTTRNGSGLVELKSFPTRLGPVDLQFGKSRIQQQTQSEGTDPKPFREASKTFRPPQNKTRDLMKAGIGHPKPPAPLALVDRHPKPRTQGPQGLGQCRECDSKRCPTSGSPSVELVINSST